MQTGDHVSPPSALSFSAPTTRQRTLANACLPSPLQRLLTRALFSSQRRYSSHLAKAPAFAVGGDRSNTLQVHFRVACTTPILTLVQIYSSPLATRASTVSSPRSTLSTFILHLRILYFLMIPLSSLTLSLSLPFLRPISDYPELLSLFISISFSLFLHPVFDFLPLLNSLASSRRLYGPASAILRTIARISRFVRRRLTSFTPSLFVSLDRYVYAPLCHFYFFALYDQR
ncbi:hypothetical protein CONPUDRAFT_167787 [Coniophora puteana RWD-64-598 SS2]|uniref:Uncharacterized protein n=1 Tax=Coniophora puteana (strain RWD-64-598) TaxID=741705 RepID=A0A5M3MEL3_CONPW|nr:uncharacterized protein CONPUDRAFT_167787 [Coniophora puteana RWD-64-598 SS2]EIW77709.1 hypothetical protein CONPUDRAFT_167787 [Coniophora puteana RWD-64-598 SS2]